MLGAFLVRSGVLTSVHAFAVDPKRGVILLGILAVASGTRVRLVRLARAGAEGGGRPVRAGEPGRALWC